MSQMVSSIVRYDISTGNVQEMVPWMLAVKKAVNESAIPNSLLRSGSKIMQGERRGIQVNQHNTNPVKTKKNTSTIPAVTAEGDALEHNMNATAASKLSTIHDYLILKPLDLMECDMIATASSKLSTIHNYLILKMLDLMERDMIATASSKLSTIHNYLILKTLDLMLASVDSKLKEYCTEAAVDIYLSAAVRIQEPPVTSAGGPRSSAGGAQERHCGLPRCYNKPDNLPRCKPSSRPERPQGPPPSRHVAHWQGAGRPHADGTRQPVCR